MPEETSVPIQPSVDADTESSVIEGEACEVLPEPIRQRLERVKSSIEADERRYSEDTPEIWQARRLLMFAKFLFESGRLGEE